MRVVVQRVRGAAVRVAGATVGEIAGPGLLVLVGVTHDDTAERAAALADKVWGLRIFDPPEGGAEVSAADLGAPVLVVSQFTLYGDTRRGRRPSWSAAAPRPVSEPLVDAFVARLREVGAPVQTGEFGAHMEVSLVNDGPVTLVIDG